MKKKKIIIYIILIVISTTLYAQKIETIYLNEKATNAEEKNLFDISEIILDNTYYLALCDGAVTDIKKIAMNSYMIEITLDNGNFVQYFDVGIICVVKNQKVTKGEIIAEIFTDEKEFVTIFYSNKLYYEFSLFWGGLKYVFQSKNNTPLLAFDNGTVTETGFNAEKGRYIRLKTQNYIVQYSHLNTIYVSKNDVIKKDTIIATSGQTGRVTEPITSYDFLFTEGRNFLPIFIYIPLLEKKEQL